tara:strand:- start:8308 stop:8991 length:684 start_codon:yes stop_codon:yes gene_type:complete
MKTIKILSLVQFLLITLYSCNGQNTHSNQKMTKQDSVSYSIGHLMAGSLKSMDSNDLDFDIIAQGIKDALNNSSSLSTEEAKQMVNNHMSEIQEKLGAEELNKGKLFLDKNSIEPGVEITESGLQYRHEVLGTGDSPTSSSSVTVHYKGTLLDGTVFDSSYDRGEPVSFPLNGVISGWTEGLQLMKVGGKTTFFIPQNLAYGANPRPNGPIPPYATLIFEVELISIQ